MVAYSSLSNELARGTIRASFTMGLKVAGTIAAVQAIANAERSVQLALAQGIDALKNNIHQDLAQELVRAQEQINQLEQLINDQRKSKQQREEQRQEKKKEPEKRERKRENQEEKEESSKQSGEEQPSPESQESGGSAEQPSAPESGPEAEGLADAAPAAEGAEAAAGAAEGAEGAAALGAGAEGAAVGAGEAAAAGGALAGAAEGAEVGMAAGPEGALIGAGVGLLASEAGVDVGDLAGGMLPEGGVGLPGGGIPQLPDQEAPTEPMNRGEDGGGEGGSEGPATESMPDQLGADQQGAAAGELASSRNAGGAAAGASKAAEGAGAASGAGGAAAGAGGASGLPGSRVFLWEMMGTAFEDPSFLSLIYIHLHPIAYWLRNDIQIFKILEMFGIPADAIIQKPDILQTILLGCMFLIEFLLLLIVFFLFVLVAVAIGSLLEGAGQIYVDIVNLPGLTSSGVFALFYNFLAALF